MDDETMPEPCFALEEEGEAKAAARARADEAERAKADLAAVLATDEGRRVMRRLLAEGNLHCPSFTPDALVMAFNEGNRNFGLRLLAMIAEAAPSALAGILIEQPKD